jgi:hypothetical protein
MIKAENMPKKYIFFILFISVRYKIYSENQECDGANFQFKNNKVSNF